MTERRSSSNRKGTGRKTYSIVVDGETDIEDNRNNPKIHILINTPCLEYWFLQHVSDSGKYYPNGQQVINELIKHKPLKDYAKTLRYFMQKNPDIYARLKGILDTGIANARKRGRYEPGNPRKGKAEIYRLFTILGLKED